MIYERKANYYETDKMAIIHHSNYIRWLEEARIQLMDEIGFSYLELERADIQIPVLKVECEYLSMVRFGDKVKINLKVEKFTGSRLEISYKIYDSESGELRTTARTCHCFINKEGRAVSLKKALPKAYEVFLKEANKDGAK